VARLVPCRALMSLHRLAAPCAFLIALAGCNSTLYSPPARPMPLESAATLPAGDIGLQVEGGVHGRAFGPTILAGSARVRHGLARDLELAVDASALHVGVEAGHHPRAIYSARGGAKVRLARPLALAGGFGGGYSAAGAFVSPEVGPILAWENRYAVPFVATRLGVSQPVSPRALDVSEAQDGSGVEQPRTTWIASAVLGVRVPLGWSEPEAGTTRGSLLGGLGLTHLADNRDKDTFVQLAVGGEVVF
jgi:hypothetical protein